MNHNQPKIIKVSELLTKNNLKIPNYQRPYKWTTKNVNQLIDDILMHKDKSEYRLGTLVVHNEKGVFNIVDGQQRIITLTLIAYAIIQNKTEEEKKALGILNSPLLDLRVTNDISKANIQNNYKLIKTRIADFDEETIRFFLKKCTLVEVVLKNISDAFQFFDSQNARGKELEPHDLLKAFHLRAMNNSSTEEERKKAVEKWESYETAKLSELFSEYLFRIRNWSNGYSAQYFSKDNIDMFKGIDPDIEYPFAAMLRIAHFYVEEYNRSYHRNIDKRKMVFPFQIDGTIINGKRFFEMIEHYQIMIDNLKSEEMSKKYTILNTIKTYEGSYRTGDIYIRNLFYCGLIYYIDKFGDKDLQKAIEKIFIWAYTLRLKLQSVRIDSVDNYALHLHQGGYSQIQMFKKIKEAIKPADILNLQFEILKENQSSKTDEIVEIFKNLGYYEKE